MRYDVYKSSEKGFVACPGAFSPWAYLFGPWWAFWSKLWLLGAIIFVLEVASGLLLSLALTERAETWLLVLLSICFPTRIYMGLTAGSWRASQLVEKGYSWCGEVSALTSSRAVQKARQGNLRSARLAGSFIPEPPTVLRGILAITWLTWKAAVRYRLFVVVAVLLLGAVVGLPLLIKDDGTARGFTQIVLTYTLTTITALLGLCTLWLACGTLARDIEECQMQVVATKPIARWEIWLGKWLGIMSLNAVLLTLSGTAVYGLLMFRAGHLPADQRNVLRNEVLVARGSVKPAKVDAEIERRTEEMFQERLKKVRVEKADLTEVRRQVREQVKAAYQLVPPGYPPRSWELDLGLARNSLRDKPLTLRIKFNAGNDSTSGTFEGLWLVGVPQKTKLWRSEVLSFAPNTFHEIQIPPYFDEKGILTVSFVNPSNTALIFPLGEGVEVLYPEGTFGLNFFRGMSIIFCWMALLAAVGLAAASFLSFPVAAFCALAMLAIVFSTTTMSSAVDEGTIANYNAEKGIKGSSPADIVVIPMFRAILKIIGLAKEFSPIDSLSTGRSITWAQLGFAVAQIILLLGGVAALFGITVFTRRELATAQGTQ